MGLGSGASKGLPGRIKLLWPLSVQEEWGFLWLVLSRKGNKEAELSKELCRDDMAGRKGCVSHREQNLLERVFNIWLTKPNSLEVHSNFISFPGFHLHFVPSICALFFIVFSSSVQPFFLSFPSVWPMGCFSPTSVPKITWLGCSNKATINSCICNLFIFFHRVLQQASGEGYKWWMQVNNTGVCGKLH